MSGQWDIKKVLGAVHGDLGFVAKGLTWRRRYGEINQVVTLQKSNFDASFFLNIGFWINELGEPDPALREEQCHV